MSRNGNIVLAWGDGEYEFRLGLTELEKLQEATDCGPAFLLNRLRTGTWKVGDIRETLRWGLVGGGKTVTEAAKLLKLYVDDMPWMENLIPAQAVLMSCLVGAADEPVGDDEDPKAEAAKTSPTENSPSPLSTNPES